MSLYAVVSYIQGKYITALVEATNETQARWKGLMVLDAAGYETHTVSNNPTVYKIEVNDVEFNPSERGTKNGSS